MNNSISNTIAIKRKINKTGIVFGILYGLVTAGFYVTPWMFFLLGLASISTIAAMQNILMKDFGWLFLLLGIILTLTTIIAYLRAQNIKKLTLAEIKPYRAFIGGIVIPLLITYAILITIALFTLEK